MSQKLQGFEFWQETLRSAQRVIAPMVDQSELAWRMMSRAHGAQLCYTPMLHASIFVRDSTYRTENLVTCAEDKPLIVQFCANDKSTLLKACLLAQDKCDAVDLNIGCPQAIAKRGHYGAFLQDEWELLANMISECHKNLSVPITAKIRVFPSVEKTVRYAKTLEKAGVQLLTVHGRTREQKGPLTGIASWEHIKAVREAIKIPVFANGNIQYLKDVDRCIEETGVQGVMIAEGSLHNPALFDGVNPPMWEIVSEYLDKVRKYPCNLTYVRGHLFKMCIHAFDVYNEWRMKLGECKTLESIDVIMGEFMDMLKKDEKDYREDPSSRDFGKLKFPYWICQPYVRSDPQDEAVREHSSAKIQKLASAALINENIPDELRKLSKKKLRKALRNPAKTLEKVRNPGRPKFEFCTECKTNARGLKCLAEKCKVCCRRRCQTEKTDCEGHNIYFAGQKPRKARNCNKAPS